MLAIDNETYAINFKPGCCGNFISAIIWSIVEHTYTTPLEFPQGNAHYRPMGKLISEYMLRPDPDIPMVDRIEVRDKNTCLFLDHDPPDWDLLFAKFPNAKNIVVTSSTDMYPRIQANFYFKNVIGSTTDDEIKQYWENFPNVTEKFLSYDLRNIPENELAQILLNVQHHRCRYPYPFNDKDSIPETLKDKVFPLRLYDIIHSKELVLNTLSEILRRKVPPHVHQTYDNYLAAQHKLMPWLNDV